MTARSVDDSFLTVADVAELLKLNQQTVRNWIDQGQLSAVRLGQRRVRIRQSELDRFIARGEPSRPEVDEIQGPTPPVQEHSAAEERKRFRAAMAEASAAIDDDPHELAVALNALADAARALAGALSP